MEIFYNEFEIFNDSFEKQYKQPVYDLYFVIM